MLAVAVAASWVAVLLAAILLGLPFGRQLGKAGPDIIRVSLWVGLASLTVAVVALSLVTPLKGPLPAIILVTLPLVVGGTVLWRTGVQWSRRGWTSRPALIAIALFAAALAILAIGATLAPTHYDFALYHYSGLSWAAQYGTVPGLANLIDYLGYSNSATPWSAALLNGPAGYAAFAGLWAGALVVDATLRMLASKSQKRPGTYIALVNVLVVLAPLLIFSDIFVASPTSDTAVFALLLVAGASLADGAFSPRFRGEAIVTTLVPLLVATSMRPQILLVAGVTGVVLLILAFSDRHYDRQDHLGASAALVTLLGLMLGALSMLRDYRLTGWAVYPLSLFPFDVPWRVEDPFALRAMTIGIARDPGPGYQNAAHGYDWLMPWVGRQLERWETWVFLVLLVIALFLALTAWRRSIPLRLRALCLVALPSVVFILSWVFLLPPTWRHSWGAVFGLASIVLGWFAWRVAIPIRKCASAIGVVVLATSLIALFVRFPAQRTTLEPNKLTVITTESGLELLQPVGGDDRCGIAPLLCTPMPRSDLRLVGDSLGQGFTRDLR